jgi:hypothetical protein
MSEMLPPPEVPHAPPAQPTASAQAPRERLGAPAPATSPVGGPGPLGKPRSIGLVLLLSIVTFGIWTIVWSYQNGEELKRHTGNGLGAGGYLGVMLANIVLGPIPAIAVMFLMASEVEQMYRRDGKEPPITTIWGLWFLLPLIGNLIWYVRIQRSLNDYWTSHGSAVQPGL